MIIIYNFITLCRYLLNNVIGCSSDNCIEFEYINVFDYNEPDCNCNLCYIFRNIGFFTCQKLKIKN